MANVSSFEADFESEKFACFVGGDVARFAVEYGMEVSQDFEMFLEICSQNYRDEYFS